MDEVGPGDVGSDPAMKRCVVGILVGGASRRMGSDKATLRLPSGQSFLEHIVGVVDSFGAESDFVEEVVLLGELGGLPESVKDFTVLPDAKLGAGPLAGLSALLDHAGDPWVMLLACDLLCLGQGVLHRLMAQVGQPVDAVAFTRSGNGPRTYHACCALYHPRVKPVVEAVLCLGNGSLQRVLSQVSVVSLEAAADELRQLTNVNTPEELSKLTQL